MKFSIDFRGAVAPVSIRLEGLTVTVSPVAPLAAPVHFAIDALPAEGVRTINEEE